MPGAGVQCCVTNAALSLSLPPLVTKVAALPKGIVWKVLNDATDLVKLDLVTIDDHFNYAVMQMLIAWRSASSCRDLHRQMVGHVWS